MIKIQIFVGVEITFVFRIRHNLDNLISQLTINLKIIIVLIEALAQEDQMNVLIVIKLDTLVETVRLIQVAKHNQILPPLIAHAL